MSRFCFWILTDGTIVQPDSRHILAVTDAPFAFGESLKSLEETFKKYGQGIHSNFEGKAREETLLRVINKNHIRIRKNQQKRSQYWSIQLYNLTDKRRSSVSAWAKYISTYTNDKYADIIIHQLHDNSRIRTSLDILASEYNDDKEPVILTQDELVRKYSTNE